MPDAAPSVNRLRRSSSRSNDSLRFRHRPYAFDTSSVVPLQSSSCQSPDLVLPRPFPPALTTTAFARSRQWWFGACSCKPVPRGPPSSIKQLHTSRPFRPSLRSWRTIIRKTCILDVGVFPVARGGNRLLQHSIHLSEVEVAEQRRYHAPYTKGNFQFVRTIAGWRERYALLDLRRKQ